MTVLKKAAQYHEGYLLVESETSRKNLLSKDQRANETPSAHRLLRSAHQDAISLDGEASFVRGYASIFSVVSLGGAILMGWGVSVGILGVELSMSESNADIALIGALLTFLAVITVIVLVASAIRGFRLDLFAPKQVPIVFNRKTRKVYRFIPDVPEFSVSWSYFASTFRPWPMLLVEYDWDCLDAEYWEQVAMFGTVAKTMHVLQFKVRQTPGSKLLIGGFVLGSPMTNFKESALETWEFIRRFMEEGGPHVVTRSDLAPEFPTTWFQSARLMLKAWPIPLAAFSWGMYAMFSQGWESFWRQSLNTQLLQSGAAFMGGIFVLGFTFNWLSFRFFAPDVKLPPELHADAGPELDLNELVSKLIS